MNAKMSELKCCFESAGFTDVRTVLASGNVVFNTRLSAESAVERNAEAAMAERLDRTFYTIARSVDALREMIERDPYRHFRSSRSSQAGCHAAPRRSQFPVGIAD